MVFQHPAKQKRVGFATSSEPLEDKDLLIENDILVEGRNCWRTAPAHRLAFLIDGAAYFSAFAEAVLRARKAVIIVGWDINSKVRLVRGRALDQLPVELGPFLNAVLAQRRKLHVYILVWDYALIYALERETMPILEFGRTHRRMKFRLDGNHPIGGSHHQKIVVVDDAMAFVGGMDLTKGRWDTPEHLVNNPLRVDPYGRSYPPHHDVQLAVDGEAAALLGNLARERWKRATGRRLRAPKVVNDPWPEDLAPDLNDVGVGIARTEPRYGHRRGVREIEQLYLDSISAAKKSIYIENLYLTAPVVVKALTDQLQKKRGPDVVLVLNHHTTGWLEETTMGVLRARRLKELEEADKYQRLRVCYPIAPGSQEGVYIHSKVLVIDNRLVRIGSSNLNNRSMGLDTECDLVIEARAGVNIEEAGIERLRNRLLGEHLGVAPDVVGRRVAARGLSQAVDDLHGAQRTLVPLDGKMSYWLEQFCPDSKFTDPEQPMEPERLIEIVTAGDEEASSVVGFSNWFLVAWVLLAGGFVAWCWPGLSHWLAVDAALNALEQIRATPTGFLLVIGGFLLGSLVLIPITVLILTTASACGPLLGFIYSLGGCLMGAAATYGLGRLARKRIFKKVRRSRLRDLKRRVLRRGPIALAMAHILPWAPFSIVNIIAGASHVRFGAFMAGTLLGLIPTVLAVSVFAHQLQTAVGEPSLQNLSLLAGITLLLLLTVFGIRRRNNET